VRPSVRLLEPWPIRFRHCLVKTQLIADVNQYRIG
jgi:hypothetical protein